MTSVFDFDTPSVKRLKVDKKYGESSTTFSCEPEPGGNNVTFENTYCMAPPRKFRSEPVQKIIEDVLQEHLDDKRYDSVSCALAAKILSQEIKMRVKRLQFERYKLIVVVSIGEKKDQGVYFGSRCVWNTDWDSSASASFENNSIYAVGCVYAMYYE